MGSDWKIFDGDANPYMMPYIVETTDPKYVSSVKEEAQKIDGVSDVQDGGANTKRDFLFG